MTDYWTESNRWGHTQMDFDYLPRHGRNVQPREDHRVPCSVCRLLTWNVGGRCDEHYLYPNLC